MSNIEKYCCGVCEARFWTSEAKDSHYLAEHKELVHPSRMPIECPACSPPFGASPTVTAAGRWLHDVAQLLYKKNAKYGDSAANPMRVFSRASPVEQILTRIDDKLSRIAKGAGLLAADEDVLRDLVGYLALLAALMEKKKEGA